MNRDGGYGGSYSTWSWPAAVLLLQGGEDNRAQAEIYGTWLRGAGKTVEVVIYEGDGHPPRKPEHVRDRWSRTGEWFRKALAAKAGGIPSRGGQRA